MLETYEQNSKRKLVATLLATLVIAGTVVFADHIKAKSTNDVTAQAPSSTASPAQATSTTPITTTPPSSSSDAASTPVTTNSSGFKDGTYSASSSYFVPHSTESIQVSLTITSGVVTGSSIRNSEGDNDSAQFQSEFTSAYKNQVVGKKISDLHLNTVAGASDTTQAFNDAVAKITSQAKA